MVIKKRSFAGEAGLPLSNVNLRNEAPTERFSTKAQRQEFFLPVTGFGWMYPEEVAIINHPAFQRLGRINQLGQAHLVFRGATHKRIEHVLGAVSVIQKMIAAVQFNAEKSKAAGRQGSSTPLCDSEERFVRLGALLHDIGHLAAGHTLEDELELIGKHDADDRLSLIFDNPDWNGSSTRGVNTLRKVIDANYSKYLPPGLAATGMSATELARLLIRKPPGEDDKYKSFQDALNKSAEIRYKVCSNMIGNTICADLLDYIYRDWYHVGRPRTPEDRIFQYMEVRRERKNERAFGLGEPRPDSEDRFVIALGEKTKIRTDGISAILGLLEWRYELAETVLFHRTKLSAGAMLDRALYELWEKNSEQSLVQKILPLSDDELIDFALEESRRLPSGNSAAPEPAALAAESLLQKLRDRALFKELGTFDASNLPETSIPHIKRHFTGLGALNRSGANCRAQTARVLESDFDLDPGSIAIYCSHISPKIAQVAIDVDGEILAFSDYEKKHKKRLSGGHLDAQIERFERLWRIYFFIDAHVKSGLSRERLLLIRGTLEQVVLGDGEPDHLVQSVKEKAMAYVQQERASGINGIEYVDSGFTLAKNDPEVARPRYPNGAPSIKTFIKRS